MKFLKLFLQRFSEGPGDGNGQAAAADTGERDTSSETFHDARGARDDSVRGARANQPSGKAFGGDSSGKADAAGQQEAQAQPEKRSFSDLINGEYKDDFSKAVQNVINKRFAQTKQLESESAKQRELLEMVSARYGVDAGNLDGLRSAIESDQSFLQEQADKAGMSVEQFRKYSDALREAERAKQFYARQQHQAEVDRQVRQWQQDAEQVKTVYSGFDLNAELQNGEFVNLLKVGIPMKQAYEVLHMQDLLQGTAAQAEQQAVQNIQRRAARPSEGAAGSGGGSATVKNDVTKLTREDRERLAQEAMRGKVITFS